MCDSTSGETQVLAQVSISAGTNNSTVGVLASTHKPVVPGGADSWQAAALVYNSDDNSTSTGTDDASVSLTGLAAQTGALDLIQIRQVFVSERPAHVSL